MRMTFEQFKTEVMNRREEILPETLKDAMLSIEHVKKVNHSYDALQISAPGTNYGVAIDLNRLYRENMPYSFDTALNSLKRMIAGLDLTQGEALSRNSEWLADYSSVKDSLFVRCSNANGNAGLLENCPHTVLGDLAFTVHVGLDWQEGSDPSYTTMVTNDILNAWGVDRQTLLEDAVENSVLRMPVTCRPLSAVMQDFMGPDGDEMTGPYDEPAIFVLSNTFTHHGAAAVIYPGVLDMMQERIGNFYMLPSSIHEFLLLPESMGMAVSDLERMGRDVNASVLLPEDYLSNTVYHYDGVEKRMEPAQEYVEKKEMEAEKTKDAAAKLAGMGQKAMQNRPVKPMTM